MPTTPNPPAFEEAVRAHLAPDRAQFNYTQMLHTFLSVDRFRTWAALVDAHRPVAGARFLSSGCGYAGSLMAYADAGAVRATGVEIDHDSVALGRLRLEGLPQAEVLEVEPGPLAFEADTFDIIESMDVIEHVPDPEAYLADLSRVLAPGGVLLLVTPNRLWPVEQHLGILGPPWLPVAAADGLFGLASRLPGLSRDRAFRYRKLRGMRTQNVSLRRLRRLARWQGLFLRVLDATEHGDRWPLPRQPAWLERLAAHRFGSMVAPVRTLVTLLHHADAPPRARRPTPPTAMRRAGPSGQELGGDGFQHAGDQGDVAEAEDQDAAGEHADRDDDA